MNFKELAEINSLAEQELNPPPVEEKPQLPQPQPHQRKNRGLMTDWAEPGDNANYLQHALASWNLPRVDTKNPKEVEARVLMYFEYCIEHDIKPHMVGLASWLGVSRSTLLNWRNGKMSENKEIMEKAVGVMESLWADYMQNGKINPVSGIFLGKAWYGYRDQTEYIVTPNTQNIDTTDQLIAEAKMLPGLDG